MTTRRAGLSCLGDALALERRKQRLEALLSSLAIRVGVEMPFCTVSTGNQDWPSRLMRAVRFRTHS